MQDFDNISSNTSPYLFWKGLLASGTDPPLMQCTVLMAWAILDLPHLPPSAPHFIVQPIDIFKHILRKTGTLDKCIHSSKMKSHLQFKLYAIKNAHLCFILIKMILQNTVFMKNFIVFGIWCKTLNCNIYSYMIIQILCKWKQVVQVIYVLQIWQPEEKITERLFFLLPCQKGFKPFLPVFSVQKFKFH